MTPIVRAWRSFGVPLRVTAEGSGWPQSIVGGSCRHPALWSLEFRVRCPIRVTARGYKGKPIRIQAGGAPPDGAAAGVRRGGPTIRPIGDCNRAWLVAGATTQAA